MIRDDLIWFGNTEDKTPVFLLPKMANRHGLIAGATGTGKTVTLKVLAESFSEMGVPVFMADVKGDVAGLAKPGEDNENMQERIARFGLAEYGFDYTGFPVTLWDIYGKTGIPLRTTVSEMGPLLLARVLDLNDLQSDILSVVFKIADDNNLLLVDTKDLKSLLTFIDENASSFQADYGKISSASLGVITRAIVALETQGGDQFFGEPALNVSDWLTLGEGGKGMINILDSSSLINNGRLYSTFLLWLISELYETLPEVGDLPKPKLVFFFDEAHLLFNGASKALLEKIEQAVKLIRSKGVGIYFCTQNPRDIPDNVLAQLNNKIEHGLRAYTPNEQKAVRAIADAFRENPAFDTFDTILNLGTGEALVSVLDADGIPTIGEKVSILPPRCSFGSLSDDTRDQLIKASLLYSKYYQAYDPDSAFEFLQRRGLEDQRVAEASAFEAAAAKEQEQAMKEAAKEQARIEKEQAKLEREAERERQRRMRPLINAGSSAAGSIGRDIGKALGKATGNKNLERAAGNAVSTLTRGLFKTLMGK